MKCPKCSYVSHDYLDACRKCGVDLVDFKKELHLQVAQPGDLDLSLMLGEHIEELGNSDEFTIGKAFFETEMLVEPEEGATDREEGFDISLEETFPDLPATAVFPPQGSAGVTDTEHFTVLDEEDKAESDLRPAAGTAVDQPARTSTPVDMIDMSDLEELDGVTLDLPDEAPDDVAPEVPEWERPTEVIRPPTLERGRDVSEVPDQDEDITLVVSDIPRSDGPPARAPSERPGMVPELPTDNLLEAEIELELDTAETPPAPPATRTPEPKADLEIDLEDLKLDDDEDDENIGPSKRT
ncbi:MAG TPA: hypothetical protein VIH59_28660 [Candidatus Tectomicrobia bacterium]